LSEGNYFKSLECFSKGRKLIQGICTEKSKKPVGLMLRGSDQIANSKSRNYFECMSIFEIEYEADDKNNHRVLNEVN
jgi:hypothetical protein